MEIEHVQEYAWLAASVLQITFLNDLCTKSHRHRNHYLQSTDIQIVRGKHRNSGRNSLARRLSPPAGQKRFFLLGSRPNQYVASGLEISPVAAAS